MKRTLMRCALFPLAAAVIFSCAKENQTKPAGVTAPAPVPTPTPTPTPTHHTNVSLSVTSIRGGSGNSFAGLDTSAAPVFTYPTTFHAGFINAGPPDYLKLTVKRIEIYGSWGCDTLWTGTKELLLDGSPVDVSDMNADLRPIHAGTVTEVRTYYESVARIKGTLSAEFNISPTEFNIVPLTAYTKSAYPYNAAAHAGGADSLSAFTTGPAEEAEFRLSGEDSEFTVMTLSQAL